MDNTTSNAVEGLQKIMVLFSHAGDIAKSLETFASVEASAAGWIAKVKEQEAMWHDLCRKYQDMTARCEEMKAEINAKALEQKDVLDKEIADQVLRLAQLKNQVAERDRQLQDVTQKVVDVEARRSKLLSSLGG